MKELRRKQTAFTLIELLVVVAIIGLLIAILVPNLSKARDKAKLVVCQTHLHAWGIGFIMYATDNNGRLPLDGGDGTPAIPIGKWDDPQLWFNGVVAYTKGGNQTYDALQNTAKATGGHLPKGGENSIFVCPMAGLPAAGVGDALTSPTSNPPYPPGYFQVYGYYSVAPVFTEARPMLLCYGMNSQLRTFDFSDPNYAQSSPGDGDVSNFSQLRPAAMVPLMVEKRIRPDELPNNHPSYSKNLAQSKITANRFTARHNNGGSIVFADGHVQFFKNADIDNPKAVKTNYYNIPGVITWNPNGP